HRPRTCHGKPSESCLTLDQFMSNAFWALVFGAPVYIISWALSPTPALPQAPKPEHPALARYPNWPAEIPARNPYLPPKEFDHPYNGTATVTITRTDVKGVREACNTINWEPHMVPTGCSVITRDRCDVYILNDELLRVQNVTYDVIW